MRERPIIEIIARPTVEGSSERWTIHCRLHYLEQSDGFVERVYFVRFFITKSGNCLGQDFHSLWYRCVRDQAFLDHEGPDTTIDERIVFPVDDASMLLRVIWILKGETCQWAISLLKKRYPNRDYSYSDDFMWRVDTPYPTEPAG